MKTLQFETLQVFQKRSKWQYFWKQRIETLSSLDYKKQEAFLMRFEELKHHSWDQKRILNWLEVEHHSLSLTERQKENLEKIKDPQTRFIFTGQQPQILTGSIYTLYKALTVVEQATQWERQYHKSMVPIFWIAGDDTDTLECGHLEVVEDYKHYNLLNSDKKMLSYTQIQEEIQSLLPKLKEHWSVEIIKFIETVNQEPKTLSQWFKELLQFFLGHTGILFLDAASPLFRELAKPKIKQVIENSQEMFEFLKQGSQDLLEEYGKTQVKIKNQIHAFEIKDNYRFRVESSGYNEHAIYTHDVLSRPILISFVFPVMAHVLGPGELGYFLQLREVFKNWEKGEPLMISRMSASIFPLDLKQKSKALEIDFETLMRYKPSEIKKAWVHLSWKKWVESKGYQFSFVQKVQEDLEQKIKLNLLPQGDYQMPSKILIQKLKRQEFLWLESLQKQFFLENQKQYLEFLEKFEWFCSGRSQERCLNLFSLVNQWGFKSLFDFLKILDPLSQQHQLLFWKYQ